VCTGVLWPHSSSDTAGKEGDTEMHVQQNHLQLIVSMLFDSDACLINIIIVKGWLKWHLK